MSENSKGTTREIGEIRMLRIPGTNCLINNRGNARREGRNFFEIFKRNYHTGYSYVNQTLGAKNGEFVRNNSFFRRISAVGGGRERKKRNGRFIAAYTCERGARKSS